MERYTQRWQIILSEIKRFDVRFHPDAEKEYKGLDNSVVGIVNKSIDDLEIRADEVGKPLKNNTNSKLAGCREKKLRDAGVRIIFKVTKERVDVLRIVYILTIEKRSNDFAFKIAHKRNQVIKRLPKNEFNKHLRICIDWRKINKNKKQ